MNPLGRLLSQVLPRVATHDVGNHTRSNSKLRCERAAFVAASTAHDDRLNLFGRQFGVAVSFTVGASEFLGFIRTITRRVTSEQVIWSNAWWIVALVKHVYRQLVKSLLKAPSVSKDWTSVHTYDAVSGWDRNASPYPARLCLSNMFPETFVRCSNPATPRFNHYARLTDTGWVNRECRAATFCACLYTFNHRFILQH